MFFFNSIYLNIIVFLDVYIMFDIIEIIIKLKLKKININWN